MITRPEDALHKSWLNRVLIEVADDKQLSQLLIFKGGTCASMLGYLNRFSIDLDFDIVTQGDPTQVTQLLQLLFSRLGLRVKNSSPQAPLFILGYPSLTSQRSTLKLSVSTELISSNQTQTSLFPEIDRYLSHQTVETMFAHKLVAVMNRYQRHASLAGRDIYDIHHFFLTEQSYLGAVIQARTQTTVVEYLTQLSQFIQTRFTQVIVDQDINLLLSSTQFQQIRKVLLPETISLLKQEAASLERCI